jgi:hypothetical protein
LVFIGILTASHSFQGGEGLILFQIGLFSCVEEMYVSLLGKPSALEAGASSTLFPCESCVSFRKEYFLQRIVLKVE